MKCCWVACDITMRVVLLMQHLPGCMRQQFFQQNFCTKIRHMDKHASSLLQLPTTAVQLPDGNEIAIGPDRFQVPEVLFQPVSDCLECPPACFAAFITLDVPLFTSSSLCEYVAVVQPEVIAAALYCISFVQACGNIVVLFRSCE